MSPLVTGVSLDNDGLRVRVRPSSPASGPAIQAGPHSAAQLPHGMTMSQRQLHEDAAARPNRPRLTTRRLERGNDDKAARSPQPSILSTALTEPD
ncbi:hypothetical protein GGTG_04620 [Gaeumannomyces tritici R3-111a-1]|uniref:Uncharacterized protein n=1 Tax=Gaeumannomyces tritici (strain R3-111a-1) TaxID=644352 RepID=J3NTM0_GAET3|nr:hypothetical protein GGTG_04620 [Gaeumannomyces tritici R3-111a-1]EJT79535.1 hypothetical protein GGTG_04620 [Gaeumannomyces tritici R3-111a-1]